eukprot:m.21889 g.21889  ORF g.21889 m.21889 type:complete len:450 (+) comp3681_c0_seq2:2820-4169(+)
MDAFLKRAPAAAQPPKAATASPASKRPDPDFREPVPKRARTGPLADRVRPKNIESILGQDALLGAGSTLRQLIDKDAIPSMIFWGPPGCGKTTLAKALVASTSAHFIQLSAIQSGVTAIREAADAAAKQRSYGRKTILFIDEIHHFNKSQQDAFLPLVESGLVTLVGATTENPSFNLNAALLSRCRVFVLGKLPTATIEAILRNALANGDAGLGDVPLQADDEAISLIAASADGDARTALNSLEMAAESAEVDEGGLRTITLRSVQTFQKTHLVYDKSGDQHYDTISALHKSMRGNDANAALYWLGRMLEGGEDPRYIARRLVRFASEDIGMADPNALPQAVAATQAVLQLGMPECDVCLAQCVAYLALAPKSVAVYKAVKHVRETIRQRPTDPVPLHIRNAPTALMKNLGYGAGYVYTPDDPAAPQTFLPDALQREVFLADCPNPFRK